MKYLAVLAALLLVSARSAQAQTAASPPAPQGAAVTKAQVEPQKRAPYSETDFQFKFNSVASLATTQFGAIQTMFANDVPSLDTLTGNGLGQAVIQLNSCAIWNPHSHPRANEILYVAQGNVKMGFQEENKGIYGSNFGALSGQSYGGRTFNFSSVPQGSSIIVPQALPHYIWNPNCDQALIVSSFDNKDPGASSLAQSLFAFPAEVLTAATGLEGVALQLVQQQLANQALVSYDKACLTKCKLPIPAPGTLLSTSSPAAQAPAAGPAASVSDPNVASSSTSGRKLSL